MFPRVQGLIARGHQVANNADGAIAMGAAFIADLADGAGVKLRPSKGFGRLLAQVATAVITWGAATMAYRLRSMLPGEAPEPPEMDLDFLDTPGHDLPFTVILDPTVDVEPELAANLVRLQGGPWDGRTIDPRDDDAKVLILNPPDGSKSGRLEYHYRGPQLYEFVDSA